MLGNIRLRPKGAGGPEALKNGQLPLPGGYQRMKSVRGKRIFMLVALACVIWFLKPLTWHTGFARHQVKHPKGHPPGSRYTIPLVSQYIYPPIEDANLLRKLDPQQLVHVAADPSDGTTRIYSLNYLDNPDPHKQQIKEDNENAKLEQARAKNHFKNQLKVVYLPKLKKPYPKVVVVTAVDYDKYSTALLAHIVQNRVNYAHEHGYGLYVRWYQEFFAEVESLDILDDKERSKWVRIFCLRAAMFAFPDAEWFWYFDQDGIVANIKVDLYAYLLEPEALRAAMLREQPIAPPHGLIKTYKNIQPNHVRFIFTQIDDRIATNSFLVKNDEIGRAVIDSWRAKLYLNYGNFPHGPDSAITHLLQWHPFVLSKSTIVSTRTINSLYDDRVDANKKAADHKHYFTGDLLAQWSSCSSSTECENMLNKVVKK